MTLAAELLDALSEADLDALADALAPRLASRFAAAEPETHTELLSVAKAARRANVHPETVRRAVRAGALRAARAGSALRIDPSDLDAWLSRPAGAQRGPDPRRRPRPAQIRHPLRDALRDV